MENLNNDSNKNIKFSSSYIFMILIKILNLVQAIY